jgi:hypothetical protein
VTGLADSEIEYRRGILVYCTARLYEIDGLINHALATIVRFSKYLSIAQILDTTCDVYAKLPEDEVWLPTYLRTQLEIAFNLNESLFSCEEFLRHIGENATFSRALVKIMGNIYADKLTSATIFGRSLRQPQESGQHAAEQLEEGPQEEAVPEDCLAEEDFENLPPPPPCVSVDDDDVDTEKCPSPPSAEKEELTPDMPFGQLSVDELHSTDEDVPPLSVLEGLCCERDGFIKDYSGQVIGEVVEGDAASFSAKMYFCNGNGDVCDYKNRPVGKCKTLISSKSKGEKEKAKNNDIWGWASKPSSEVPPPPKSSAKANKTVDIWGTLGTKDTVDDEGDPAETTESDLPPLSILKGHTVDADGKVYSDDNIAIGECVEGDARKFARKKFLINGKGNVVTGLGKVLGKCVVLPSEKKEDDPPLPPPAPEPVEEPDLCPERVQHMRNGGGWKTCRKCCNSIRQMSIQLLHEGAMSDWGDPVVV